MTHVKISITTGSTPEPPPEPAATLWRVPHDFERVNVNVDDLRYRPAVGMTGRGPVRRIVTEKGVARPEIFRVFPSQTTPIGESHQWLWRNLNPELSGEKFCTLFGPTLAWTNQSGFPPRRNYILQKDMENGLPNFHAPLVNGGHVVEGEMGFSLMQAIRTVARSSIDTVRRRRSFLSYRKSFREMLTASNIVNIKSLLVSGPVPTKEVALADQVHFWSWGVSINPRGEINYITRLGVDGNYKKVRILWLTKLPVWLPADELDALAPGEIPEPIWSAV